MGLSSGTLNLVVMYDYETIKEVFGGNDAAGRNYNFLTNLRSGGSIKGILDNDGHDWKVHRRYWSQIEENQQSIS